MIKYPLENLRPGCCVCIIGRKEDVKAKQLMRDINKVVRLGPDGPVMDPVTSWRSALRWP